MLETRGAWQRARPQPRHALGTSFLFPGLAAHPAHIHTSHPALFTSFPRLLHPSRQPKQSILFICNTPGECSLIPSQLSSIAAALMDHETTPRQCLALNFAVTPQEAGTMVLADHPCWVILSWGGRTSTMHALLTKRDENDAARCRCR